VKRNIVQRVQFEDDDELDQLIDIEWATLTLVIF
jgi:hypothetical protein